MIDKLTDIAGIASAFSSVATGISTLKDAVDPIKKTEMATDLRGQLIAIQSAFLVDQDEYSMAKKELAELKDWSEEKANYQLQRLEPGVYLYRRKPDVDGTGTQEDICADCYNANRKSFLHVTGKGNGLTRYKCNGCGATLEAGHFVEPRVNRSNDWAV